VNADSWRQAEECYHAALERPPHERAAFVAQACANNSELRREVESLLAHEGQADELLESPAWNHVTPPDETGTMAPAALAAGSVLAAYRIVGKLGAGGMGEVYRATDPELQREVALKVLAPNFADDREWLSRFQREARVLASLNHPHIAAVYGLEESNGVRGIAMELVEGPTLAERIARKRIPVKEALAIAKQIAEALEYAHEKGIVHRDLKPANVKLRPDGVVKVLDFGLAKPAISDEAPTTTATRAGIIVGTPAYMAPEQAAGMAVDRRADIWAFGVVLFEMLSGQQIYARETTLATLAAVARDEPRWDELPAETPAAIVKLLRRCLDKDPKRRLQAIGEARIALEEDQVEEGVRPSNPRSRASWIAAAALLALAAAAGWIVFLQAGAGVAGADWKLSIVPPPGTELPSVGSMYQATPEISPDGTMIVCRLGAGLQLRKLNSTQFVPLRGTTDAVEPFWAPDSQWIGFFVNGALMKMQVPDGAPELLWKAKGNFAGGTWGGNGTILFGFGGSNLQAIPATGGSATPLQLPKSALNAYFPHFLPDGEHFLFSGTGPPPSDGGPPEQYFYLGGWSGGKWTFPAVPLTAISGEARYSPAYGGSVLFVRNDNLYAQKLNISRTRLEGSPILVETSVASSAGSTHSDSFSVSRNGVLAWRPGREYAEQLTWFDRHGNPVETAGPTNAYLSARPSADERRIAAIVITAIGRELRVLETGQGGFLTILSPDPRHGSPYAAVWNRDNSHLLYTRTNFVGSFLTEQSATGSSEARDLGRVPSPTLSDLAPDGALLMMVNNTLNLAPIEGDRTPRPLLASDEQTSQGAFSPDGRWVVYASSQAQALFVQAFPISGPRRQISTGGSMPYWRRDGHEIVYLGPDSWVCSVRLDPARGEFHDPERLFAVRSAPNSSEHLTLAVTRDGSRILFNQAIDQPESRVIDVAFHR
jgi:eukaryotic-like serine/threonine-protein kinase